MRITSVSFEDALASIQDARDRVLPGEPDEQ
jgi:hypothetical protein